METPKLIDLHLIDEPENAMRSEINEEKLNELTESIRQNGILQALVVRQKGERFEVIAGHRRLLAARRAGLSQAPCLERVATDTEVFIIRMHENLVRHDVDVVSEARFIAEAITKSGFSEKELSEKLGRSEAYIRDRLTIAEMPEYIIVALRAEKIKLGVALALFEITDEQTRFNYVNSAIADGCTVENAKEWLRMWRRDSFPVLNNPETAQSYVPPTAPPVVLHRCEACGAADTADNLRWVRIHIAPCGNSQSA